MASEISYEKITLLVSNSMGYSLTSNGAVNFEEVIEDLGFGYKLISEEYKEVEGPQIKPEARS